MAKCCDECPDDPFIPIDEEIIAVLQHRFHVHGIWPTTAKINTRRFYHLSSRLLLNPGVARIRPGKIILLTGAGSLTITMDETVGDATIVWGNGDHDANRS